MIDVLYDQVGAWDQEIRTGFQCDLRRLKEERHNLDFYHGKFERYNRVISAGRNDEGVGYRDSLLTQRAVNTLTQTLYAKSPTRVYLDNEEATDYLESWYGSNGMFALMQEADRLSMLGQVCAVQVAGAPVEDFDPASACPVRLNLWDAAHFSVFVDKDDPRCPAAVVTFDVVNGSQPRATLWTKTERRVYLGKPGYDAIHPVPEEATLLESESGEHGYGVLPFAFVHFNYPTTHFWSGGPGNFLRRINEYLNLRMIELADTLRQEKPILAAEGWDASTELKRPTLPGQVMVLPFSSGDVSQTKVKPAMEYIEPSYAYVPQVLADLNFTIDHTLEMLGIPPAVVRAMATQARSGASVMAENQPLIMWAERRIEPAKVYERAIAKVVMQVAAAHLENNGHPVPGSITRATTQDVTVRFPDLWMNVPRPDLDTSDKNMLALGLTSPIQILQRRYGYSHEEAVAYVEQMKADNVLMAKVTGIDPAKPLDQMTDVVTGTAEEEPSEKEELS